MIATWTLLNHISRPDGKDLSSIPARREKDRACG